jgi:transglutaminase-like putative cysteine protease
MILRSIIWFINWLGMRTVISLSLLVLAVGSVAWAVDDAIRGLGLGLLLTIAIGAVLLGWGLGAAGSLPAWLAGILIAIIGVEAIMIRVAGLGRMIIAVGANLIVWLWEFWQWPFRESAAAQRLLQHLTDLGLAILTLLSRLLDWSTALGWGEPAYDPAVNAVIWSLALWLVSAWAAWGVRRLESPLLAMVPAGTLLATMLAFSLSQVNALIPVLAATLLLIGLSGYYTRKQRWLADKIDFASDIWLDLAMAIVPISLALVIAAALAPSISIREISRSARQVLSGKIAQVEPVLGISRPVSRDEDLLREARSPGLPRQHLLGSGPELSEQIALIISLARPVVPAPVVETNRPAVRFYWRSLTYDVYTSHGWRTGPTQEFSYEAGTAVETAPSPVRSTLRQSIQTIGDHSGLLYAAGDLVTADHDFVVNWRGPNDAFATSILVTDYRVDAHVPAASTAELRTAGTDYPEPIRRRYLSLPDRLPDRVVTLARDLTATALSPYDRAIAIETYLRTFPYSLDLPEPPLDRDMVDYFLFDLQQGYCDYYATSMVVLARAAGVPARLAVGYASGTYDPSNDHYVVTEADAHSWPEIYFPQYGWIEFEPTAAQPLAQRSAEPSPAGRPDALPALEPATTNGLGPALGGWLLLPGLVSALVVGALLWSVVDSWRLHRLTPSSTIITLYERLQRRGQQLATTGWTGATPFEFAADTAARVNTLANTGHWARLLAPAAHEVHWLTSLYVLTTFSTQQPDPSDQAKAIQTWQGLRHRLWLARLAEIWLSWRQQEKNSLAGSR